MDVSAILSRCTVRDQDDPRSHQINLWPLPARRQRGQSVGGRPSDGRPMDGQ
jgi:hypothetical protein